MNGNGNNIRSRNGIKSNGAITNDGSSHIISSVNSNNKGKKKKTTSLSTLQEKLLLTCACCAVFLLFRYIRRRTSDGSVMGRNAAMRLGRLRDAASPNNNNNNGSDGGTSYKRGGLLHIREAMTNPNYDKLGKHHAQQILSGHANLIDIRIHENSIMETEYYTGIIGTFCPLNFQVQKDDPPNSPMFRDVVGKSEGCDVHSSENVITVDLAEAIQLVREFDTFARENEYGVNYYNVPKLLKLRGVVFHESRCGSTLAANTMMAMDPLRHRVYSESAPPIAAIKACGELYEECSLESAANLLRDVIYLMGRSADPRETNLFFKFQSISVRNMDVFRMAFPNTPWIYLYREPVEVMMSQLDVPQMRAANCVRSHSHSPLVARFVSRSGYSPQDLDDEEWCAIHLATICEAAIKNLNDADGLGLAVNYHKDLVHDFIDTVFPKHFNVPLDQAAIERVLKVSGTYSKNRGSQGAGAKFKSDSEAKEREATDGIRKASSLFLEPSFNTLQHSRYNIRNN